MKKLILPVAIIGLAVGAAFGTQKASKTSRAIVPGHIFNETTGVCDPVQMCQTDGVDPCVWDLDPSVTLKELSGTACPNSLFRL